MSVAASHLSVMPGLTRPAVRRGHAAVVASALFAHAPRRWTDALDFVGPVPAPI